MTRTRIMRLARTAAGVATIAAVWAPGASADTFCVADPGCVAGGGTSAPDLQSAVDAAGGAAGRDRIQIGPGSFAGATADAGNEIEVAGAGRDRTTLTQEPGHPSEVLQLNGDNSKITDLKISVPPADNAVGLYVSGTAERLTITSEGDGYRTRGIVMENGSAGTVRDVRITTPPSVGTVGIDALSGGSYLIDDVTTSGGGGIRAAASTEVRRARITTATVGVSGGSINIYDTAVRLRPGGADPAIGVYLFAPDHSTDVMNARHLTVGGTGQPGSIGLKAEGGRETLDPGSATLNVSDSVVAGVAVNCAHTGPEAINADHSTFAPPPSTTSFSGTGTPLCADDSNGNITADPRFLDGAGGDLRLRHDSPAVDAGTPGALGGGEPATDLDGHPRLADGNADGTAVRDMGAFEYGRGAPTAVASVGPAGSATGPGAPFRFLAGGSSDPDGEALTYAWAFDDGGAASGDTAEHAFATAGPHSGTLTVTDPTGQSATATASFTVSAPPPVPPPAPTDHGRCGNKLAGTPTGDLLTGSRFGDRIDGGAGDDVIGGQGGSDCLNGGAGRDRIGGGTGHDSLTGGAGNDVMGGENGNDSVSGGSGNDILDGDAGNDRISGGSGNDSLDGGAGRNVLSGGKGNDWIYAQNGVRDVIDCGPGRDHADVDKHLDKFKNCEHVRRLS